MSEPKKETKARVLVAQGEHQVDDLVMGAEAEAGIEAGWADGSPAAVAYASKLARRAAAGGGEDA